MSAARRLPAPRVAQAPKDARDEALRAFVEVLIEEIESNPAEYGIDPARLGIRRPAIAPRSSKRSHRGR